MIILTMEEWSIMEILGWLGAFFYILAYLLLTIGFLKSEGFTYHLLNVLGAVGLIINAVHFNDKPNVVVNLVWLVIGVLALLAFGRRYRRLR